jgi:hypothetical protein
VDTPFRRPGWVNEEKYDGYRALAYKRGNRVRLYSRNAIDRTADFPEIVAALGRLPGDFVLDGEVVAFDPKGVSRFQRLQRRELGERVPLVYAVFDCLEVNGVVLTALPARKEGAGWRGSFRLEAPSCGDPVAFRRTARRRSRPPSGTGGRGSSRRTMPPPTSRVAARASGSK